MELETETYERENDQVQQAEEEDDSWHRECVKKLAQQILEERNLKLLVVQKEQENLEKQRNLEQLRKEHLSKYDIQNAKDKAITIDEYQRYCIEALESRIDYLQKRAKKIQHELDIANNNEQNEHEETMVNDQDNFVLQENINDLLYENKTLEKYVRSENFRIYDETIGTLTYNIEQLKEKLDNIKTTRRDMEDSNKAKKKMFERLQKKLRRKARERDN